MSGIDFTDLVQALVGAASILVTTLAAVAVQALRQKYRLESEAIARREVASSMLDHADELRAAGTEPTPELVATITRQQMPDTVGILRSTPDALARKAAAVMARAGG